MEVGSKGATIFIVDSGREPVGIEGEEDHEEDDEDAYEDDDALSISLVSFFQRISSPHLNIFL